ncbi:penton [California sea lion adenovirus 1]|uniref:Penton protein n=1 Tax=California sea lion adenovirus 1 TaxID=943083 RepID=A0A059XN65_9ADEN|nr:penton [California sea lion adenovirus 1]AIA22352.1 penton [California sea lion adenovirus 1]
MDRYSDLPPSYESVMAQTPMTLPFEGVHVPPRYRAPTEGRNSIRYTQFAPLYDTTKIYLVDNKSADIPSLNYQNDHSSFLTTVIQNSDFTPLEAGTQSINLDERSNWGGEFKTLLHMNMPNITQYMYSNSFKVKLMSSNINGVKKYEWFELSIPEGNYTIAKVIDLMNNAIVDNYLKVGRQNGVKEEDIGVKIDTRNFMLGFDPISKLIMPGVYTYEAYHPDIILLPECAIDFTNSRLNNLLGIRKKYPFQQGFIIDYDMLKGGNIPALLDLVAYGKSAAKIKFKNAVIRQIRLNKNKKQTERRRGDMQVLRERIGEENIMAETVPEIKPLLTDSKGRSYHVNENNSGETFTAYRSWFLAYNFGPESGLKSTMLLTNPDVTCGVEQVYWSLPDMTVNPVTFKSSQNSNNFPVVGTEMLPLHSRSFVNPLAVYSQMVEGTTNQTHVFNRFPENQILMRAPASGITSISENVPTLTNHGILPLQNNIPGVQRVVLNDARRRTCPYVYKALGVIQPKVLSSKNFLKCLFLFPQQITLDGG